MGLAGSGLSSDRDGPNQCVVFVAARLLMFGSALAVNIGLLSALGPRSAFPLVELAFRRTNDASLC